MRTRVQKWGNSLAIRIPASLAREIDLAEGSQVDIEADGRDLHVTPAAAEVPTLEELLASVKPGELHGEIDWGPAQGNEVW